MANKFRMDATNALTVRLPPRMCIFLPQNPHSAARTPAPNCSPFFPTHLLSLQLDEEARFLNSAWEEDLASIPKVGPATKAALMSAGITTTYKLIGQFLMCVRAH